MAATGVFITPQPTSASVDHHPSFGDPKASPKVSGPEYTVEVTTPPEHGPISHGGFSPGSSFRVVTTLEPRHESRLGPELGSRLGAPLALRTPRAAPGAGTIWVVGTGGGGMSLSPRWVFAASEATAWR